MGQDIRKDVKEESVSIVAGGPGYWIVGVQCYGNAFGHTRPEVTVIRAGQRWSLSTMQESADKQFLRTQKNWQEKKTVRFRWRWWNSGRTQRKMWHVSREENGANFESSRVKEWQAMIEMAESGSWSSARVIRPKRRQKERQICPECDAFLPHSKVHAVEFKQLFVSSVSTCEKADNTKTKRETKGNFKRGKEKRRFVARYVSRQIRKDYQKWPFWIENQIAFICEFARKKLKNSIYRVKVKEKKSVAQFTRSNLIAIVMLLMMIKSEKTI